MKKKRFFQITFTKIKLTTDFPNLFFYINETYIITEIGLKFLVNSRIFVKMLFSIGKTVHIVRNVRKPGIWNVQYEKKHKPSFKWFICNKNKYISIQKTKEYICKKYINIIFFPCFVAWINRYCNHNNSHTNIAEINCIYTFNTYINNILLFKVALKHKKKSQNQINNILMKIIHNRMLHWLVLVVKSTTDRVVAKCSSENENGGSQILFLVVLLHIAKEKMHLWPSNPKLTTTTLQILYSDSLIATW